MNKSFLVYLPGLMYTAKCARRIIGASKTMSAEECRLYADEVAADWGEKIANLIGSDLSVDGLERLKDVHGRFVFVCQHKSFLDFAIFPAAIKKINEIRRDKIKPRYLAARDHFLDNPFLCHFLGMGMAMRAIGTIFVDRKSKKTEPVSSINEAIEEVCKNNVDIVIFPQGTRAFGRVDRNKNRIDSGYYTTARLEKIERERPHLRKGAAHLALGLAKKINNGNIYIVPVGLIGTGRAAPRKSVLIEKGVRLKVVFGKPFKVDGGTESINGLNKMIDMGLREAGSVDKELSVKLFKDFKRIYDQARAEAVFARFESPILDQSLIFSIADYIYSMKPKFWDSYFIRLYDIIMSDNKELTDLMSLKKEVANEV